MVETNLLSGLDTTLQDHHLRSKLRMFLLSTIHKVNYLQEKLLIRTQQPQS
jgi:hypothetical protein